MTRPARRSAERYLIPVEGLRVPEPWTVGRTVIHPGDTARQLLDRTPPLSDPDGAIAADVYAILDGAADSSVAEVHGAPDRDTAIDHVAGALDALRLFQLSRRTSRETAFGLPGDLYRASIRYVAVWDRAAPGWHHRGDHAGWTFTAETFAAWHGSGTFPFLSDALAADAPTEGQRRAVIGTRLLARAALEHQPDLKMIGVAAALEAWLLHRDAGSQTMRLARLSSWFGCHDSNGGRCGGIEEQCPYLHLDPGDRTDRRRLGHLRELGNTYAAWRCSEWHRVMNWYDARSGAAHGDPSAVTAKEAEGAEFWTARHLAIPILDWLRDHPDDPVGDLDYAISAAADANGLQRMRDAIAANPPPVQPPIQ